MVTRVYQKKSATFKNISYVNLLLYNQTQLYQKLNCCNQNVVFFLVPHIIHVTAMYYLYIVQLHS